MRFYSLKPQCSLCGWIGMPYALRCKDHIRRLERDTFNALVLCDGQRDFDTIQINDNIQHALLFFEKEGIVEFHDEPRLLQPDQYYRFYDVRYFQNVLWSITGKCNYKCRHCYLEAPDAAFGEITTEEAFRIIDQMAACGICRVELTGGEPLIRIDFWQLVDRLCEHGITIDQIYTNGWLLTEKTLDNFSARHIKPEFIISFDGIGWHDWMRGIKGAEEDALRVIRMCKEKDFSVSAEMCIHEGNKHVLRESVLKLAAEGVRGIKVSNIVNNDLWLRNSEGREQTIKMYIDAMLEYIPHFFEDGMPIDLMLASIALLRKGSKEYSALAEFDKGTEKCLQRHICGSARVSCYIGPDGRLLPCMPIASAKEREQFPKVQDIGLKQAFNDSYYMQYVDRRVKDLLATCKTCRECPYHLRCGGGCRATAVLYGEKDLMGPDPSRCMMWKEGYLDKLHTICDAAIRQYCER